MTERLSPDGNSGGFRHRPEYSLADQEVRERYLGDAMQTLAAFMQRQRPDGVTDRGVKTLADGGAEVSLGMNFTFTDNHYVVYDVPGMRRGQYAERDIILKMKPTQIGVDMHRIHNRDGSLHQIGAEFWQHHVQNPDLGYEVHYILFPATEDTPASGLINSNIPNSTAVLSGKTKTMTAMTRFDCEALQKHLAMITEIEQLAIKGDRRPPRTK